MTDDRNTQFQYHSEGGKQFVLEYELVARHGPFEAAGDARRWMTAEKLRRKKMPLPGK